MALRSHIEPKYKYQILLFMRQMGGIKPIHACHVLISTAETVLLSEYEHRACFQIGASLMLGIKSTIEWQGYVYVDESICFQTGTDVSRTL